ncbi:MAG: polysaccharide biosynthesis protein [Ruminococcaceae bacterium]|nr:polysaccharide biosynthesis protein [Oscillospiraceae bacterium]
MEELWATYEIARVTSLRKAIITLVAKLNIQIMNRNGFKEPPKVRKRLIDKHNIMIEYFENRFGEFYRNYKLEESFDNEQNVLKNKIWICWWQGEENAPELVKRCIESIRRNAGGCEVVLITEENYMNYVNIPECICEKYRAGIITKTNLSDLLRLSLLARHGGMWIDATFFCTDNISLDEYFKYPLWSIKRPDYLHCSIASGYFAGYSLACDYSNRYIFAIVRDFFLEYWSKSDKLVDYLLVDYMIVLAQKYEHRVKEAFDRIEPNNPNCDELLKNLGLEYNEDRWNKLKNETGLFKLSWKQSFPLTVDGKETFYSKIMDKKL